MRLGDSAKVTNAKLKVFWNTCYSQATVYRLHKEYRGGHLKVGDKPRTSQPARSRTAANIQQCDRLVKANRRVGIVELSKTLGISYGSVFQILHKDVLLKKRASKLVPHVLTPAQKRDRVRFSVNFLDSFASQRSLNYVMMTDEAWFYIYDPRPKIQNMQWLKKGEDRQQVPRRPMGAKKVLLIPFFDRSGLVHWEFFINETVKNEMFLALLQRVRQSLETWWMRVLLHRQALDYQIHMDNAPAHCSDLVKVGLQRMNWTKLKHPAYSPDLSPADFFLFPYLKRLLRGRQFGSIDRLILAIDRELGNIPLRMWRNCFTQ